MSFVRQALFCLGLFSLIACGGTSDKSDDESGDSVDAGGSRATGGRSAGGSSGKSGSAGKPTGGSSGDDAGGNTTGGGSSGGSPEGGSVASGGASATPGEGGEAGASEGGTGNGATAGLAGRGGSATGGTSNSGGTGGTSGASGNAPMCDPATGELENTPYPTCAPRSSTDPCELCIEASCCTESKTCYGYNPGNVCGWGGPTSGTYGGLGEIDCYVQCAREYVSATGYYDDGVATACVPACTTPGCGLIGNATQDLVVCLENNCETECFTP
jgi:hypothetical protein